jgi:SAM-dependent methyltransferase
MSQQFAKAQNIGCPVCDTAMKASLQFWVWECPSCGFLRSTLCPKISQSISQTEIDEAKRADGLHQLRQANFRQILTLLSSLAEPSGQRLLDVGCAHGWFLQAAREFGFKSVGLEPDLEMSYLAQDKGFLVWQGYFPEDIPVSEKFDVIVFNDVLEHLPDVATTVQACHRLLSPAGLLVVNLPSSHGIFYQLATLLARCGFTGTYDRLWQKNFPSPHLSYFHPELLKRLVARYGFTEIERTTLPAISVQGLWSRLRYDRSMPLLSAWLIWLGVALASPLLDILPADISLQIFRKVD